MRAVIQRVKSAYVAVGNNVISKIGIGLLVLFCVEVGDCVSDLDYMEKKITTMRIFPDDDGKMNRSICDISGEILLVSQFTLSGDARRGTRPSYSNAARPEVAVPMYEGFSKRLAAHVPVKCGIFGADMQVSLINDGPVTLLLDSKKQF